MYVTLETYEKKTSALLSKAVDRNGDTENVLKTADPLNLSRPNPGRGEKNN